MAIPQKSITPRTYEDYLKFPSDERWEIIDGVAYNMSPAPATRHQEVAGTLYRKISDALEGRPCRAFIAPFDVRLPLDDEPDDEVTTVLQPDVVVICERAKVDTRGCRGAPDFVIEVASFSSTSRDQIQKARVYERHGVKEYWVVHPWDRLVYIRRLGADGLFGNIDIVSEGTVAVRAIPGLSVDLSLALAQGWGD